MEKAKVAIIRGKPFDATKKALKLVSFRRLVKNKSRIIIKPNLVLAIKSNQGITTDVNVVRAIVEEIPQDKEIIILEGSTEASESFKINNYNQLEKNYKNVKIVDANKEKFVEVSIRNPLALNKLKVCKLLLDSDFIISVAKLKVHSIAKFTGTLKNMMGICSKPDRLKIHAHLPKGLIDLLSVRMPDFGVIDGIVANEIDENIPHPVKMGIILCSKNVIALDSVAAKSIGISPTEVLYLKFLNSVFPNKVIIIGESIEVVRKNLKINSFNLRSLSQKIITLLLIKLKLFEWYNKKFLYLLEQLRNLL